MCGIWGYITTEKQRGLAGRRKYLSQSALVGTLRGYDSTGMFLVPHKGNEADWIKNACTGEQFLYEKGVVDRLGVELSDQYAVVGHNRAATIGKVTTANAHPFVEGPITLVHNGTLTDTDELPTDKANHVTVDSHLIAHNLSKHSPVEVLESLVGAYTLVWHDSRDGVLRMARNSQRPLALMKAKCEDTVLFASEADMLWWIAGRTDFSRDTIYTLDPGVLLEFTPGSLVAKPTKFKIAVAKPKPNKYYNRWYDDDWVSGVTPVKKPATDTITVQTRKSKSNRGAQADLAGLGLHTTSVLDFEAEQVLPVRGRKDTTIVNGWVYWQGKAPGEWDSIQAIIYGCNNHAITSKSANWLVRPVGITYIGDKGDMALICNAHRVTIKRPAMNAIYPGPDGGKITAGEWLNRTTAGCGMCHKHVTLNQADAVLWMNNAKGHVVLCPPCADRWRSGDKVAVGGTQ